MIALDKVEYIKWTTEDGATLREARENQQPKGMSRRKLARLLVKYGLKGATHANIQLIEMGEAKSVSVDLLKAICKELQCELWQLLPMIFVGSGEMPNASQPVDQQEKLEDTDQ